MEIIRGIIIIALFIIVVVCDFEIVIKNGISIKVEGWQESICFIVIVMACLWLYMLGNINGRRDCRKETISQIDKIISEKENN